MQSQAQAQAYAKTAQTTGSPRELEAQLLLRAASRMQAVKDGNIQESDEVLAALRYNRRLWLVFASALGKPENPLPAPIRLNVANLANFVIHHSMRLEADAAGAAARLGVLININRELAAGLRSKAA